MTSTYPDAGIDEIHPRTTIDVTVFGQAVDHIEFEPKQVTLRVRRGEPYTERGLLTIDTEMIDLHLEGESGLVGPFELRGGIDALRDDDRRILGKVVELEPGRRFPAENFFNVYVEVETRLGKLFNTKPEHMSAIVDTLPPNFERSPYRSRTEINLYPTESYEPETAPLAAITMVTHG